MLYCCANPEAKITSVVRHSVAVKRSFDRRMVTGEGIFSGKIATGRSVRKRKRLKALILTDSTRCLENVSKVDQDEEADCGEEL